MYMKYLKSIAIKEELKCIDFWKILFWKNVRKKKISTARTKLIFVEQQLKIVGCYPF